MATEPLPILTRERNLITLWEEAIQHEAKGQVTYDKVLFVKIVSPGDTSEVIYEVEREYAPEFPNPVYGKIKRNEAVFKRFGDEIERWKKTKGIGLVVDGTPIEAWAQVDVRMAAHLKYLGFFSVEALATGGDSAIEKIGMGGRALIQKAKAFVEQRESSAKVLEAEEKNRALEARLQSMQDQIEEMGAALDSLPQEAKSQAQEEIKRRRGRPPKVQAA
jgi:hypothetical protein